MKKVNNIFLFNKKIIPCFVIAGLVLLKTTALYSQDDQVLDTVVVSDDDSLTKLNNYEAVEEETYNYYDHLVYWPADTFTLRKVPDSVVARLKASDDYWYADKDFKEKEEVRAKPTGLAWLLIQNWFKVLIWTVIIGGFAAVLIWFLVNSNVRLFSKKAKAIQNNEGEPGNIFEINFTAEINKAIQLGDYRLATRLLFLRLLKNLADKKIINYKEDATNFDYVLQLSNSVYYKDFFKVTRYYEYAWYGGFEVNENLFDTIKKNFDSLDAQVIRS